MKNLCMKVYVCACACAPVWCLLWNVGEIGYLSDMQYAKACLTQVILINLTTYHTILAYLISKINMITMIRQVNKVPVYMKQIKLDNRIKKVDVGLVCNFVNVSTYKIMVILSIQVDYFCDVLLSP